VPRQKMSSLLLHLHRSILGRVADLITAGYKFLQKPLEETNLAAIIQYTHRFNPEQRKKLAIATALIIQVQLVPANVLSTLQKDHLVKDGE
jgi:ABC-type microcin C transport system duplicated ATPase subunit YejF